MASRVTAHLFVRVAILSGTVGLAVVAVESLVGGGGLAGLMLVLVGGVVAGSSLVNAQPIGPGSLDPRAASFVETLDPLAHGDAPGSGPVRRFLYGLGLVLVGGAAVVLLG